MEAAAEAYLAARKKARMGTTDSTEQPEPVEAIDVLEDSTPTEEAEAPEPSVEGADVEEVEESEQPIEAQEDDGDLFYYEIDGEEVSSEQLKEWKNNGLMQSDYTRKTQAHAEDVKSFNAEKEKFTAERSKLSEQLLTLEAMINEDNLTDEQIAEMREYEPEKYIEHIEKQNKRKEFLKSAKTQASSTPDVDVDREHAKLVEANPQWIKDGQATQAYNDDMAAITKYYQDNGFTEEQMKMVNQSAALAQAVIEAARFKTSSVEKAVVEKRVRKAPVSTKPKAQATNAMTEKMKALKAKAQQGDAMAFAQLRKLQRKQKGN